MGLFLLAMVPCGYAINASPAAVELQQPDGTKIKLHIRGDEFFNWFEDERGFTVIRNQGSYVYANLDAGGKLAPTAMQVGRGDPQAAGLPKGLLPSPEIRRTYRINTLPPALRAAAMAGAAETVNPPSGVSPNGVVKNLVILCKFSDHVFGTQTRTQSDYNVVCNAIGGDPTLAPTGSVRDYYKETSYGVMDLQSTVVAWVTLPHPEAYYANGQNGLGNTYPQNGQGMVEDALNLADALVDFGQFDTDNDGYVDAIDIIHSGYAAETGGGGGNWIWSHKWSLWALPGGQWTSQDNNGSAVKVKVYDYHTEAALWGTSGTGITRIGVICHETGHFFGLPDLYDTDQTSEGIGSYCLMANSWGFDNSQQHPPHFSAWCKLQLGWVTPTVISSGTFAAPLVETNKTIFRINDGYPTGEYLLIENRQPFGFESDMPQGGLAIWHIDENKPDNTDEGYPGQSGWPANNRHYKIALLQADGLYNMEHNINRGDAGDVYRGGGVASITPATVPSTDRYQGGIIASSTNSITSISASGATMMFQLGGGTVPNLVAVGSAVNGGNGNGLVDPNECNLLNLLVQNSGGGTATTVNATLTTSTPGVTVTQGSSTYPNLLHGVTGTNTTPFQISTSPSFTCGTLVTVTLTVTYAGGTNVLGYTLPSSSAGYTITQSNGVSIVPGTSDTGNHVDDGTTAIALPFGFAFYGQVFSNATLSSNGNLQFLSSDISYANTCLPYGGFSYAIAPFWDDLYTGDSGSGEGIFTSISGTAPNRIFNIEWRAVACCSGGAPTFDFEIRLDENSPRFDIIYGTMGGNGSTATVGAQKDTGSIVNQFECNTAASLSSGLMLTFQVTCSDGGGACTNSLTPFQMWQFQYFGSTNCALCGTNADFDGDGTGNLQEFLAGTDPTNSASTFRITSILHTNNDIRITWMTGVARTNALQATAGIGGNYGTNNFADIFTVTNTAGSLTNYLDVGAGTNKPSRFYRVRLVP